MNVWRERVVDYGQQVNPSHGSLLCCWLSLVRSLKTVAVASGEDKCWFPWCSFNTRGHSVSVRGSALINSTVMNDSASRGIIEEVYIRGGVLRGQEKGSLTPS